MNFKIYRMDFGVKIAGVPYEFDHVVEVAIEDPEKNNLTRGTNAKNMVGLAFKEGMRDPKRWTVPILDMSLALKAALDDAFEKQTRLEPYGIDRDTGSSKILKNAILANKPQQLNLNDSPDSLQVSLEFVSFDSSETLKEA